MALLRVKVEFFALNAKKPFATLRFDETNVWTGWPEVVKVVSAFLTRR